MKSDLAKDGYIQNMFPFSDKEIEELKVIAKEAVKLEKNSRKMIFKHFPRVKELFEKAIKSEGLNLKLTDYCFYIEKTDEKNWPLMYHADSNLPDFLNIKEEDKEQYLKSAVMFRLTLDSSDKDTGALKVIRGSHIGKGSEEVFVNTKAGELILFKPLLQHASNKMTKSHTRRVFQALCIEL